MPQKQEINIVWFKRDLRFTDHEPLFEAQKTQIPLLFIYCFEPSIMQYPDSDIRHWRFVYQSLMAMQVKLKQVNTQIYIFKQEAKFVFEQLNQQFKINTVFSHEEIGNKITFDRDLEMKSFFKQQNIQWKEYQTNGVIRKLSNRKNWKQLWEQRMNQIPKIVKEDNWIFAKLPNQYFQSIKGEELADEIKTVIRIKTAKNLDNTRDLSLFGSIDEVAQIENEFAREKGTRIIILSDPKIDLAKLLREERAKGNLK